MSTNIFSGDPSSGYNNLINKISSNNINMSDPSNTGISFPPVSFNTSAAQANAQAASTVKYQTVDNGSPSIASPSIFSYFTAKNAVTEFKADIGEIVLVFLTSSGISYYMGDEGMIACERGGIMAFGQYLGGFVADAMATVPSMANIGSLLTKFIVSTTVYIGGNEYVLTNATKLEFNQMFGESLAASVVAHYAGQATKTQINNLASNQYLSMYN